MRVKVWFLFFFCFTFCRGIFSQFNIANALKSRVEFFSYDGDNYGLSTPQKDKVLAFDSIVDPSGNRVMISEKSLCKRKSGKVNFKIDRRSSRQLMDFRFIRSDSRAPISRQILNDSVLTLTLPPSEDDYMIYCLWYNQLVSALKIVVFEEFTENVIIVPMLPLGTSKDSLSIVLNKIFSQSCMKLNLKLKPIFNCDELQKFDRMKNPISTDQYTDQMHKIRDAYFKLFPKADKKAFYLFVTPPFVNGKRNGFCVQSKSLSFIPFDTSAVFVKNCAAVLAQSIGYLKSKRENTENLMSSGSGIWLDHKQWRALRHNSHTFSQYDNYENIRTNNGSVAYYFWKEDHSGNIVLEPEGFLSSIHRPFKKNYVSYHLNVDEFMYYPRMVLWGKKICLWHLFSLIIIFPVLAYLRRLILSKILKKLRKPSFWRIMSGWFLILVTVMFNFISFQQIDSGYKRFEVKRGLLRDLGTKSIKQAIDDILHNETDYPVENHLKSEVLTKVDGRWYIKIRSRVLYFDCVVDKNYKPLSVKFIHDSDSLKLLRPNVKTKVRSHYMVLNVKNVQNKLLFQKLYNHVGSELGDKLFTKNPINRILLFVNGYRPTSMGHTFEDNFDDLRQNGLEYPNSTNIIYDFDRYDYWRPWNAMDSLFIDRINPNKAYYADGHFSVSTSNHGSLINFTALSAVYPKRCKSPKQHSCYQTVVTSSGWFGSKNRKTIELLRLTPNYQGFYTRFSNGRIAGRSLLQEMNEIPNKSENDTIYIVAHSMGYAYALGMIKELRGRVSFGGFYIIAPENATCGRIRRREWKEVWQYGSNFNYGKEDAPCLQDGVAPQTSVSGLTNAQRCYIPNRLFTSKGFFDSHFIGYYSWIFEIPRGAKGAIRQH